MPVLATIIIIIRARFCTNTDCKKGALLLRFYECRVSKLPNVVSRQKQRHSMAKNRKFSKHWVALGS
jgi:hypothetical protein